MYTLLRAEIIVEKRFTELISPCKRTALPGSPKGFIDDLRFKFFLENFHSSYPPKAPTFALLACFTWRELTRPGHKERHVSRGE